jgi:hypothetical protein
LKDFPSALAGPVQEVDWRTIKPPDDEFFVEEFARHNSLFFFSFFLPAEPLFGGVA